MRAGEREEIIGAGAREMERLVDAFSTLAVPTTEASEEGAMRRAFAPIEMKTPRGEVKGGIDTQMYGMGFAKVRFTGIAETLELTATTPIGCPRDLLSGVDRAPRMKKPRKI